MDFYNELAKRGLSSLLMKPKFKEPFFEGWSDVCDMLCDIVTNDRSALIYGDYDVDGLMCAKTIVEGLRGLGCTNLDIYHYRTRTHALDPVSVTRCIQGQYEYMIITDTGSSDFALLRKLIDRGIKVIVLDHHNTDLTYEDFGDDIAMINTTIENQRGGNFHLSAGALCYVVMYKLYHYLQVSLSDSLAAYAAISLFADCMDMSDELNRSIYFVAKCIPRDELPRCVQIFLNDYSAFNARYIGFWFSPRINAMFRSENLEVLNILFFKKDLNVIEEAKCVQEIEQIYTEIRELIGKVTDVIQVTEMQHFVVADLYSVDPFYSVEASKLYNYTGLIANKLSDRYGKTAVVYCYTDRYYKGSVRDIYGRNYLNIFKQLCYSAGHNAAFGLKVGLLQLDKFLENLRNVDNNYAIVDVQNEPIIMDYMYAEPDTALIEDMAQYNEFSCFAVPTVYLRKKLIGDMRETKTAYNYKYSWGTFSIQSDYQLNFGRDILIKPIRSGKTKLLAVRSA